MHQPGAGFCQQAAPGALQDTLTTGTTSAGSKAAGFGLIYAGSKDITNGTPTLPEPSTMNSTPCPAAERAFREAGLPTPDLDARLLVTETLDVTTAQLIANPRLPISQELARELNERACQRLAGRSIGRILGRAAFLVVLAVGIRTIARRMLSDDIEDVEDVVGEDSVAVDLDESVEA